MLKKVSMLLMGLLLVISGNSVVFASDDTTPPTLKSASVVQEEAKPGDTIKVIVEASDESGIKDNYDSYVVIKHNVTGNLFIVYLRYDEQIGKYEGTYTLPSNTINGEYSISKVRLEDSVGNYKYYYPTDSFKVSEGVGDITPPTLKSASVVQEEAKPGDTIKVIVEASDESGIKDNYDSYVVIKHNVTGNLFIVYLRYDEQIGKYEGTYTLPSNTINGEYSISKVRLEDSVGNYKYYYPTDSFKVSEGVGDITPPTLKSASVVQEEAKPGDTIKVIVEASDESGIKDNYDSYVVIKHNVTGNLFIVYLRYDEQIGKYEGTYTLPSNTINGEYSISKVRLEDSVGNYKYYYPTDSFRVVSGKVTEVNAKTDKVSPRPLGDSIKITATSEGSIEPEYRFFIRDEKGNLTTLQEYSSTSEVSWKPTKVGTYKIIVHAKDKSKSGTNNYYEARTELDYKVTEAKVNNVSMSVDKLSPRAVGTPITISATSSGSTAPEYRFYIRDEKGNLTTLQEYSSKDTATWTPTKAGTYKVLVHAKDRSKSGANYYYEARTEMPYEVTSAVEKVTSMNVSLNKVSPQALGTPITISATSEGSSNPEYRFYVRDEKGNLTTLQEYSSKNTVTWTPTKAGTYKVLVHAKDQSKSGANYYYEVRKELYYNIQ
ncbi:triple tyrosine motif-containing protein [Priestia megaterium]|uniref:triple tyrosine motif-containing protein n=1 Tax=Priestia megaterium TaxID=1404 RepID=UPI00389DCA82